MRSWTIATAIALGIAVLAIALLPFNQPAIEQVGFATSGSCRSPIVSAWRPDQTSGWFGYAPLTRTPLQTHVPCRSPARHRLIDAGFLAIGAVVVLRLPRRRLGPPSAENVIATA